MSSPSPSYDTGFAKVHIPVSELNPSTLSNSQPLPDHLNFLAVTDPNNPLSSMIDREVLPPTTYSVGNKREKKEDNLIARSVNTYQPSFIMSQPTGCCHDSQNCHDCHHHHSFSHHHSSFSHHHHCEDDYSGCGHDDGTGCDC